MSKPVKLTVKISDDLKIARYQGGDNSKFVIAGEDKFEGTVSTITLFEKEEAIALAKELMAWVNSQ